MKNKNKYCSSILKKSIQQLPSNITNSTYKIFYNNISTNNNSQLTTLTKTMNNLSNSLKLKPTLCLNSITNNNQTDKKEIPNSPKKTKNKEKINLFNQIKSIDEIQTLNEKSKKFIKSKIKPKRKLIIHTNYNSNSTSKNFSKNHNNSKSCRNKEKNHFFYSQNNK